MWARLLSVVLATTRHAGAGMYLDFYQLKRAPFHLTPDPAFFFGSASHHAALDALAAGMATRQGLVTITGARGIGKTTLVHTYLARVAPLPLTTIVSWQGHLSFLEILALLARRFAVPEATHDAVALLAQLQQRLRDEIQQGRTVALLIDEAQHLPRETLEQLPLLTHPLPAKELLLPLVLVGQPEMLQHLQGRGLRHWSQCRGLHVTISPMTEAESLAYIRQRVAKVALPGGPLFTEEALQAIVRHARGVPYEVNLLCATVLQAGFCAQQQPITAALVHQVRAASVGPRPGWLGRLGLAAVGLVLTAGLLGRAPFSAGPQASRRGPAAPAHSWMEARRPASASRPGAPRLQQPARAASACSVPLRQCGRTRPRRGPRPPRAAGVPGASGHGDPARPPPTRDLPAISRPSGHGPQIVR